MMVLCLWSEWKSKKVMRKKGMDDDGSREVVEGKTYMAIRERDRERD